MADLEANFMHMQLMHESLARFSENFASFLYGLNMNAFCVDFPEVFTSLNKVMLVTDLDRPPFLNLSGERETKRISWVGSMTPYAKQS